MEQETYRFVGKRKYTDYLDLDLNVLFRPIH